MDDIDRAQEVMDKDLEERYKKIMIHAGNIPPGHPGDCELCGNWSGRLVEGACSPCRDKYNLP